jgi:hypothetical protein
MLAKKTSKNQITLPKAIVARFPDIDYFEVTEDGKRIILRPLELSKADAVRSKLKSLGITAQHIDKAIQWARGRQ